MEVASGCVPAPFSCAAFSLISLKASSINSSSHTSFQYLIEASLFKEAPGKSVHPLHFLTMKLIIYQSFLSFAERMTRKMTNYEKYSYKGRAISDKV